LPIGFLRQLISFYGDNMGKFVPNYLEHTIETFAKNQEQMRNQINKSIEGMFPVPNMEEINKQNMAMFENAMRVFNPFTMMNSGAAPNGTGNSPKADDKKKEKADELKKNIAEMQDELDQMSE